jgi:hypothetical protein
MNNELTPLRLKELVSYDPETGEFCRLVSVSSVLAGLVKAKPSKNGYLRMHIDGRLYYLHRLAWLYFYGKWPKEVDHIDGNPSNNKISNLRDCLHNQNMQNMSTKTIAVSGLKGAYWHPICQLWQSKIRYENRTKSLGYFHTAEEAHKAYLNAKSNVHEFFTGRSN